MAAVDLKPLPPEEAIRYFEQKGFKESFAWQDVWQEEHAKAFTVAKALNREVLQDIRDALDQALKQGMTLEQFRAQLTPTLQAKGWWGRQDMVDPQTGETKNVQLGSPRRLRTIFETNMRTAYSAGRWERFQKTKQAFPYLRYNHTPQEHPRVEHEAWDGTILPVEDPWWNTHFTPNGWNCKCYITQVSARLMKARGWEVTDKPIKFPPKAYTNPRTGEISVLESGIDPGWSYNPGKAYLEGITPKPSPGDPGGAPTGSAPGQPDKPAPEAEQPRAPEAPKGGGEPAAPDAEPGAPGAQSEPEKTKPDQQAPSTETGEQFEAPKRGGEPAAPGAEPAQPGAESAPLPVQTFSAGDAHVEHGRRADRALERDELVEIAPHPGPQLLPADVTAEEAQASFLHGFGLAPDETKVITDVGGEPFIASPNLFTSSAGAPATYDQALLRAFPLVAAAIRTPAEIRWTWLDGPGGRSKLVRRYIARFVLGDRPVDVVVDAAPAGGSPSWSFATSLSAGDGWNLDALRIGLLAWKRGRD